MIAHRMMEAGRDLSFPLIKAIRAPGVDASLQETLQELLFRWQLLEDMANQFIGTVSDVLGTSEKIVSIPFIGRFSSVQYELAQVWPRRHFEDLFVEQERTRTRVSRDRRVDAEVDALTIFTRAQSAVGYSGVFECAALASEYFPDHVAELGATMRRRHMTYTHLLSRILRQLEGHAPATQTATALAVFDATLNAPILPIHAGLRGGIATKELHPELRALTLIAALGEVQPATNIDDCLRCADDLLR